MASKALDPGHQFELDVFGINSKSNLENNSNIYAPFKECLERAIDIAKESNWPYLFPDKNLLIRPLLDEIRNILLSRNKPYTLEVWPSVGTRLDFFHSVDGFFLVREMGGKKERATLVLFDLTIAKKKRGGSKRFILRERNFKKYLHETAKRIANFIEKQFLRQQV